MPRAVIDTVRERLRPGLLLGTLALLVGFRVILDASLEQLVMTAAMLAVGGVTDAASEAYDLRQSVKNAGVGGVAVIGATAMLAFGESAPLFPLLFFAIGGWFLLDAVQTIRHEGATERPRDGWAVYRTYVARRVAETLDDGPRTRRELSEVLDADDETVDAAIEDLRSRGVVVRDGSELRRSPREPRGRLARIRSATVALASRIARPLRLEFDGAAPDRDGGARARPGRTGADADRRHEYEPSKES